jgi:hypothetical protein
MIQIRGQVFDADSNAVLDSVTIIVKHSPRIMQNKQDGSFSIFIKPTDTLIFGLYGFRIKYLCFKDSASDKDFYNIKVRMSHLHDESKEVTISEIRSQQDIRRDIQYLIIEHAYSLERVNAFESPITAAYDKYNKKAQAKQLLEDYEFELAKNKLIKQLLDIYNKQGIINIAQADYKDFINNLNLQWDYLFDVSDYDLAVYIKEKAKRWKY